MNNERIRIRMRKTVRPDIPFMSNYQTVARQGEEYDAVSNSHGAISAICSNGEKLGVKPDEFDFVEAPDWIWNIWVEKDRDRWKALAEAKNP